MPYVKSISLRTTVNRSIAYILNPDKTDGLLYTTSLNCMAEAKSAYLTMKTVYEHFSGKKFNEPIPKQGKGSVKAIHYIQSFDPKDNVSPELAHRIAKAFARKTFGDNCQIVIATHCDKNHIHNHFIINTYGIDGQKFNANKQTLDRIKEYSDRTCLAFGIQPYDKNRGKGKTVEYNEWEHKKRGSSWKEQIRIDIDRLIASVKNIDELLYELEMLGYEVKKGKYISIRAEGQERFVRTKTLGEDYTVDSLISRIRWRDVGSYIVPNDELSEMRQTYTFAINSVFKLAKDGQKVQRKQNPSQPYTPENDIDVHKLSAQLAIINRDNIHSIGELEGKIDKLKKEYDLAVRELNKLSLQSEKLSELKKQAEFYFATKERGEPFSEFEKLQMNMCGTVLEHNNINSRDDYVRLKKLQSETSKKIAALKNSFENCKELYVVYADIARTYYDLSRGDYISRLVMEEQQKKEREAQHSKKKSI